MSAPKLVKDVKESWLFHNQRAGWTIQSIDLNQLKSLISLSDFELGLDPPALSDIARLRLLAKYGGVWADATMLCMRPIDDWIESALPLKGCGFWMHHGRDKGRGPASWFMISKKGSYIATAWNEAAREYWQYPKPNYDYFWMDRLFAKLVSTDKRFRDDWLSVPYLYCERPFQAHCLAGKVFDNYDEEFKENLFTSSVPAIKLSHHGSYSLYTHKTNAWMALKMSMDPSRMPPPLVWEKAPSNLGATYFEEQKSAIENLRLCLARSIRAIKKLRGFT